MKNSILPIIIYAIAIFGMAVDGHAQFGKFIKEKAQGVADFSKDKFQIAKDFATEQITNQRSKYDTTSFYFALTVVDNSGIYEKFELGKGLTSLANSVLQGNTEDKPQKKAKRLIDVGEPMYASRKYKTAEKVFLSAKSILEENNLTETNDYFRVQANLGLLYNTMGRFTVSEEYTRLALEGRIKYIGSGSKAHITSLNNYSVLNKDLGRYGKAEMLINKAIGLNGNKTSVEYAILLNNKAMLYQNVGRYDDAVTMLRKSLRILGEINLDVAGNYKKVITNLGFVYQSMKKYNSAESAYQQAMEGFNKKSPSYAQALRNLASLYIEMGRDQEVEQMLEEAREIYRNKFGEAHPLYANAVNDLGKYYQHLGQLEKAKVELERSLTIKEQIFGDQHPYFAETEEDLAIVNWQLGDFQKANNYFKSSLDASLDFINANFLSMSESEKSKYWEKLRPRFNEYYGFAYEASDKIRSVLGDMYNYQLATKAMLLTASNKTKQRILTSGDDELIDLYKQWIDQKETLARLYAYSKQELEDENINIDSLEQAANESEKLLSQRSAGFGSAMIVENSTFQNIQNVLEPEESAIEIIRISSFDQDKNKVIKYAALVLDLENYYPRIVKMDNGEELEGRFFKYFRNAVKNKIPDEYSYNVYWSEIATLIGTKKKVYISPDGVYNQISLNALKDPGGIYLIDQWDLVIVGNSKEILKIKYPDTHASASNSAFMLGFPEYGNESLVASLPGTKNEIDHISSLLNRNKYNTEVYTGNLAEESKLKNVQNPDILHIATHGYFQKDVEHSDKKVFGISPENARNNPLLRSGLMLSGAGITLAADSAYVLDADDNGILTAYEAMNLSLDDTQLVVLSACETGLGDVRAGEGVYGLQRAFLVAGADALIMSLWKVNDEATQQLMSNFYTDWITTGDKRAAFKSAQLGLKTIYPQPYYWGAFVLIGG